ncbi:MAG: hypothetical protein FWE40_07220 [Oscillospiraceae bacterium]|nr:hypothetical protein [Oscillospiraceae bacterium]
MKTALIVLMSAAVAIAMFACTANNYPDYTDNDVEVTQPYTGAPEPIDTGLEIFIASGELPPPTHVFSIDETIEHGMTATRDVLRIQAEQTLYNLAVVFFNHTDEDEQIVFALSVSFPVADALAPGEMLEIADFFSMGTLPWNGIAFEDATGQLHHYAIIQNQADYGPAYYLMSITLADCC